MTSPFTWSPPATVTTIGLAVLVLALTACGGSSKSNSPTTTSAQTTTAANVGLTAAEWRSYIAARDKARAVNAKAIKTYDHCSQLITGNPKISPETVNACLGNTTDTVISAGREAIATVTGLTSEVAGACANARNKLVSSVQGYISSVHATGASAGNPAAEQSAISSAEQALKLSRSANDEFEQACKPIT